MVFAVAHNGKPNREKWVKLADEILTSAKRFCERTLPGTADARD